MKLNEITLSTDLNQIELEINHHKNIAGQSIWEIGRRLNHVKENDLAHGEFIKWVEGIGINHPEANRMMRVAKELPNSSTLTNLGSTALYLISTLPEEERTREHTTEIGETKMPDEMTVKELQQLNKRVKLQLEIIEQKNDTINKQAEEVRKLRQQEPQVVEKEVEIIPEDYYEVKGLYEANKGTSEIYQQQNTELRSELKKLESMLNSKASSIPDDKKEVITQLKATIKGLENWITELKEQIKQLEGE